MCRAPRARPSLVGSLLVLVTLMGSPAVGDEQTDFLRDVRAESAQPADAPILITVTLTNSGNKSITYWCGGPGNYPDAASYKARVTDSQGKVREVRLSNGQAQAGSGAYEEIKPGQTVVMPAALAPLPPGRYTIQVGRGKSAQVMVKRDPQLARKRDQDILKRIRKGEPFAQHVAAEYPNKAVGQALFQDLLSEDRQIAFHAAFTLVDSREIPDNSVAIIRQAMQKQLDLEAKRRSRNTEVLIYLAFLAAKVGSEEAMAPVLALAGSDFDGETRQRAVEALGAFKNPRATQELHGFLKDKERRVRFGAARVLADRKDPAALEVLLAVAADREDQWRPYAFQALAKFPNDPRVEPAIKRGLEDPSAFVRAAAKRALQSLHPTPRP